MSTTVASIRREAIREALARRGQGAPDAQTVAQATLDLWNEVASRLTPVIGARGVDALLGRALHLSAKHFSSLSVLAKHTDSPNFVGHFKGCFAAHESELAAQASYALMATYTDLLAALIGDSLVERLLGAVWTPAPPTPQPSTP